jgi:hypothetical protein
MFKNFFCLSGGYGEIFTDSQIHSLFLSPCKEQEEGSLEVVGLLGACCSFRTLYQTDTLFIIGNDIAVGTLEA